MGKKLTSGYYSKMLLYCIVTVISVTIALYLLSSSLIKNQEKNEYLRKYDIEINNLSSILSAKQNSMANNLSPVFSSASRYETLCKLYLESDPPDSSTTYSIVQMLKELCRYDQYCRGVLLRTGNGRLFQYNTRYDTLVPIPLNTEERLFTPFQLQVLSDAFLESLSEEYEKPSNHVYGLSNTIFSYIGDSMLPIGQLIILYDTSEFANSLFDSNLDEVGLFTITDKDYNIIYASDDNYKYTDHLILAKPDASTSVPTQEDATSHTLEGREYYHALAYNSRYEYYTSYQVPASIVGGSFFQMILAIAVLFICLASILIYIFTLRTSNKKIKAIQAGMNLVGQNNLDYRLPVPESNDEFIRIINSFNEMCDELQWNVERAYQYEISQKKAELYAMQTSINPHFLYNTLEQIRVQITQGHFNDASQMLLLLSKMYRTQTRRNLYVSIGEELELCENLINLYMYRYGNFEYEYIVSSSLKKYGVPKNTLQPLIENYFVHGLVSNRDDNLITISIQPIFIEGNEWLEFHIDDNGSSISQNDINALKQKLTQSALNGDDENGFALPNVNSRLQLVFGKESGLYPSIGKDGHGFRISFRIPPVLPENLK